jgi:hypothetical protein
MIMDLIFIYRLLSATGFLVGESPTLSDVNMLRLSDVHNAFFPISDLWFIIISIVHLA